MKKTNIAIAAAVATVLAACDQTPKFHVTGTITDAADSTLYLSAITTDGVKTIDSTRLDTEGAFRFSADAPQSPEFYALHLNRHHIEFAADSTETITFTAQRETMSTDYTVEGSVCSQRIKEISALRNALEDSLVAVEKNEAMYPGDITDSVSHMVDRYKNIIIKRYMQPAPASAAAYYALLSSFSDINGTYKLFTPYRNREDARCYAMIATAWNNNYHTATRTIRLWNEAEKAMKHTAPRQEKVLELDAEKVSETGIIEVILPDAKSRMHNIKDLKGKVVLLDFTAYSANESVERTHSLRALYDKYHTQGFEIYQVSLDDDIHFWKHSVEKLPWICTHETDGRVTSSYGVSKLPTFFLINRQNEVVVRSDFMEGTLESNVQKLL